MLRWWFLIRNQRLDMSEDLGSNEVYIRFTSSKKLAAEGSVVRRVVIIKHASQRNHHLMLVSRRVPISIGIVYISPVSATKVLTKLRQLGWKASACSKIHHLQWDTCAGWFVQLSHLCQTNLCNFTGRELSAFTAERWERGPWCQRMTPENTMAIPKKDIMP